MYLVVSNIPSYVEVGNSSIKKSIGCRKMLKFLILRCQISTFTRVQVYDMMN